MKNGARNNCVKPCSSKEYYVLMKWTLSKGVLAGIATDTNKLPSLFYDAHTSCLPWLTELFRSVCICAVAFVATTRIMALAETDSECETLKSNMSRFPASEANKIATIYIHER